MSFNDLISFRTFEIDSSFKPILLLNAGIINYKFLKLSPHEFPQRRLPSETKTDP